MKNHIRRLGPFFVCIAVVFGAGKAAGRSGTYLYADPPDPERLPGKLTVRFSDPGKGRMVIAYGWKYRKDRKSREGTTEDDRQIFKPYLAEMAEGGKVAVFPHLPRDFYDLTVIDESEMNIWEGIDLQQASKEGLDTPDLLAEVGESLSGTWEAFFDTKRFERVETDGVRACVFVQQMRLGRSLAGSGRVLSGCIHTIHIAWVEKAKAEGVGWQVVTCQQLYRNEIPQRTFFEHAFVKDLQGIRVGSRPKKIGPIVLP